MSLYCFVIYILSYFCTIILIISFIKDSEVYKEFKKLEKVVENLAEEHKDLIDLIFAKINVSENDLDREQIVYLPTIR